MAENPNKPVEILREEDMLTPEEHAENKRNKYKAMMEKAEKEVVKNQMLEKLVDTEGLSGVEAGINRSVIPLNSAAQFLSPREIRFCRFYVATGNMRKALGLAGLNTSGHSYRSIMCKKQVKAFIAELQGNQLEALGYSRNTATKNLAIISNIDIADYIELVNVQKQSKTGQTYTKTEIRIKTFDEINDGILVDEFGDPVLDDNGLQVHYNTEKTKAIKGIRYNDNGQVIIEFHDKMQALKQLTNMLELDKPQEITLKDETYRTQVNNSILQKLQAKLGNKDSELVLEVKPQENKESE